MSDKRPRVTIDLDPDIEQMIEQERQRAREENFLELSQAAAAKALLKKLRAATKGEPTPPEVRPSRGKKAGAMAIAAIGAATLFGGGSAQADSKVSTFFEPSLHILSTKRRDELADIAA